MNRFVRNIAPFIAAVALALSLAACGVTESGNPIPGPEVPEADGADIYINDTFGVTVVYPDGWSVEEGGDGSVATFSGGELGSSATIEFSILDPEPLSLAAYLAEEYPGRVFEAYSTDVFAGFVYDDPATGPDGGDLMEYFFLMDDVLIHVVAEIFAEDEAAFEELLDGIDSL